MNNDEREEKKVPVEPESYEEPSEEDIDELEEDSDDVSIYYPDGDAEHMAEDDEDDTPIVTERERQKARVRKKNSRLTKSQITLIAVIFILYTIVIVTAAWILFYKPAQPKENEIPFDITPVENTDPSQAGTNADPVDVTPGADQSEDPVFLETSPIEDQPKGNETNPQKSQTETKASEWQVIDGKYNILIVGMDKQANLADVTMIVNVSTYDNSITVMQIPRDTMITTGVATNKINAQYSNFVSNAYHSGDRNSYRTALDNYARLLEKSLCIKIHNAVMVTVEGLVDIVDACGGVDVYVPGRMYYEDPYQDLVIDIPAGWQHLDGYSAMGFVRFRSDYVQADLGRLNAQKIFISALYKKVVELVKSFDVATLAAVAGRIHDDVYTDMSISDIQFYARCFLNIGMDRVRMFNIPGGMEAGNWYYVINRAGTRAAINDYFNIYSKQIDDSIFDRNLTFCFNQYQIYCDVYYAPSTYYYNNIYDAASVDENSIYIPFKQ
ncbi:MAG: LCP family protein [Clostridiales bacterium]|nr:LCP family protein [Clostridiales bacterium]